MTQSTASAGIVSIAGALTRSHRRWSQRLLAFPGPYSLQTLSMSSSAIAAFILLYALSENAGNVDFENVKSCRHFGSESILSRSMRAKAFGRVNTRLLAR